MLSKHVLIIPHILLKINDKKPKMVKIRNPSVWGRGSRGWGRGF